MTMYTIIPHPDQTSFDIAMVVEGSTRFYKFAPTIDRWTVDATILDSRSTGSGGGSIGLSSGAAVG